MKSCPRCKRKFKSDNSLGLHFMHVGKATVAAKKRLCPDLRSAEQARDEDSRAVRIRVRSREPEMLPRVVNYLYEFQAGSKGSSNP